MADLSRVNEKINTLSNKLDELVAKASANPGDGGDGGQAQVDQIESRLDELLARLP